ncbi:predicted protein [Uncinocarpus reesii 1704]|uniref:Amine oxidase domain-containing protein n=1 Tax=Uncinocarpus reesii (strain UAMH 1704) TaxID=336963 RepID=C4JST7_UNCRE|nr:uncharacterized protein UREG_05526 [Uncinocarpus reesii 1704]EEP80684.1 predicted protein [Uncinocarpus reesii 1704]
MSLNQDSGTSIRNQWAHQHAVRGILEELEKHAPNLSIDIGAHHVLPRPPKPLPDLPDSKFVTFLRVGIIGAGASGLFTGLIFDYLNATVFKKRGFELKYDILEAAKEDRVGGRLYSYYFSGEPHGNHDYYDVGAMRFPENPVMERVFALFNLLGMEKKDPKQSPPVGSLIPYYMTCGGPNPVEPWHYNDITQWGNYSEIHSQSHDGDPFQINTTKTIPESIFKHSPNDVVKASIKPLRDALKRDALSKPPGREGWDLLMKYDTYSTRQFLGVGTNWYDQAHSETVLESLDFDFDSTTNWYCILGGAQELAKRMQAKLVHKPHYERTVTAVRKKGMLQMEVDIKHGTKTKKSQYSAIFNSAPLGCLKRMDTSEAGLNYATKQAARSLGYGASAKVGIKFKRAWWIHDLGKYNVKLGGLGHSDLTIRTCVYPSYNCYDSPDKPAVLLCSYSWQQDAERIACLFSNNPDHKQKVKEEAVLKEILLRDLARLHKNPDMTEEKVYKLISDNYMDHHAFDWYKEPNATGAFGFFRPQQFSSMWNKVIQPSGDFVIVGEAASPHHAWVVGALESAVHGVHAWLGQYRNLVPGGEEALKLLETYDPKNPLVGLPPYMDEKMSKWHSYLGVVSRLGQDLGVDDVMNHFETLSLSGTGGLAEFPVSI